MGDFSLKAILSAVDKNFSSTMKSALGYTNNLKDTLMSGIGFGAMMAIGQTAVSAVTGKMSSLSKETIETSDSMQKLQAAMRFSGYAEDEIQRIAGSTGSLKTYADKTVFSLQDVMSTFGALSANGIKDADKLTEAVGNAVAVFGGGAQEYSSVALAFSQAMAAGALHAQDWNQILNASPQLAGGLRKELIRLNPVLGEDFKGAMEDGAITADMLAEAMNNIGMTDMAKEAATSVTTFEGAMGNLEATTVSGMMKLYDVFAKSKVIDAINELNNKVGARFDWLSTAIPAAIDKISPYWNVFKTEFIEVKDAFGDAVSAITSEIGKLTGAFGSTESVNNFSDVLGTASGALKTFAGFCEEHADVIAKVLTMLPKLYVAYKGFQIVKAVAPFVGAFSNGILMLAGNGVSAIAGKLFGIGAAEKAVGEASLVSAKQMLQSAAAFLALGAGVALISAGIGILAYSAVQLANAGPLAIGVMVAMTGAVAGLMFVAKSVAPALTSGAAGFVAFGAAVILAGAGIMILSTTAINLANAGPLAIAVMVGMVAAIAGLAVGAAVLGPALTAGAVGFVAFGAAIALAGVGIALVGAGAMMASVALQNVIAVLPQLIVYGNQSATALMTLGASLIVFGAGALVAGTALIVFGAGILISAAGVTVFAAAMTIGAAGVLVMAAALKTVNSNMKSISSNAKATESALSGMEASINIVNSGLDALGNKAKTAVNSLVNSFNDAAGKAKSAGKETGNGYSDGVQNGLNKLPSIASKNMSGFNSGLSSGSSKAIAIANSMSVSIVSALQSASSGAYNSGYNIGAGLASGMNSALGTVQAAAAQLAAAADAAIRAKAQIHSPSRVSKKEGAYWGQGWVEGILSKVKDSWEAAEELVSMKKIDFPKRIMSVAGSYGGMELSEDYQYNHSAEYTILVPLEIEGREVAKATAAYTQEELTRLEKRNNRKKGKR